MKKETTYKTPVILCPLCETAAKPWSNALNVFRYVCGSVACSVRTIEIALK